ncbi:MAG: threonine/serine dehydratase [Gemmatimonadetes bacterium]|nr:threonine/serine dehydratase [Gemmatimonadota bacterium]MBI3567643.1 threonine/serine dehydratase [Gemmatimonadota bacterium]
MTSPITFDDVLAARDRLAAHLTPTPLRQYPLLDALVGHGIEVWVKNENHQPTQSFKIRNGLNSILALSPEQAARGVIGASTGNHGQGVAYAARLLGVPAAICVPVGNNPEKNAAIRAMGAELIEVGARYDETMAACQRICAERGMTLVHSTNNRDVIAGAGTMTLEMLEQQPALDAVLIALGGGSQAVGALTVAAARKPSLRVYAVGSEGAPAQYESWRRGERLSGLPVETMAEGIATGAAYAMTFDALKAGLAGFFQVSDAALYEGIRDLIRLTHNIAEGAGAAGLAALKAHAAEFAGQRVAIVLCGGNLSEAGLRAAVCA